MAYLLAFDACDDGHRTTVAALEHVRRARPFADPNFGFVEQLDTMLGMPSESSSRSGGGSTSEMLRLRDEILEEQTKAAGVYRYDFFPQYRRRERARETREDAREEEARRWWCCEWW
jgi:hypothetical protein